MANRYEPDYRGIARLMQGQEMRRVVSTAAEAGAEAARAAAPDDPRTPPEDLRSSIRVEHAGDQGGLKRDRVEYHIVADTDYAAYVQWGTKHMPAQPFLNAAIDKIERGEF